jgi:hypothetical protein
MKSTGIIRIQGIGGMLNQALEESEYYQLKDL